ncbi:MAG: DUF4157 domain-containing protein [Anaerolineaceae bacterium]|nr:DUF4157 domain-containing protein [Anaerolineaceae bacterium]
MSGFQKVKNKTNQKKGSQVKNKAKQSKKDVNPLQMMQAPETMHEEDVLSAQQLYGNQVVQRALDEDKKREGAVDAQGYLDKNISDSIQQARGGGNALPDSINRDARKQLGKNFKDVRIHTDSQADKLSRSVNARAFTIGKDVFFKEGAYSPSSSQGKETLMHELTHVVQQSSSSTTSGRLKLGARGTSQEKEADNKGKQSLTSLSRVSGKAMGSAVQKQEMEEEEEMVQGQEEQEEEMLQAQPDTIQRNFLTDLFKKKEDEIPEAPEMKEEEGPVQGPKTKDETIKEKITSGSTGAIEKLEKEQEEKRKARMKKNFAGEQAEGGGGTLKKSMEDKKAREDHKSKLLNLIKTPTTPTNDAKEAKHTLWDTFDDGKQVAKEAMKVRMEALQKLAQTGDKEAIERYKAEKSAGTKWGKTKKWFKNKYNAVAPTAKEYGPSILSGAKSIFGFLSGNKSSGDADKTEAKPEVKAETSGGGGGGGGGAMSAILEKYTEVVQENQGLKKQLEELQAKKED